MKTYIKKSKVNSNSELLVMNKEEMKSIEGGGQWYFVRREDGSFAMVYRNE